ncbi:MAG: hypothetical protein R3E58_07745 [Phycisphaerae bacterium]
MEPSIGYPLDRSPGPPGHRDVFMMVGAFALAGLIATGLLVTINRVQDSDAKGQPN